MGALDRVFRNRRGASQERPLAAIIAGLWRNGEQGVWYDVEGFRDAWNSVGPNITPSTAQVFGEASVVSPGVYRIYSSAGAFSSVSAVTMGSAVIGRKYIISFNVDSITTLGSGLAIESVENPTVTTIGPKSFLVTAVNTSLHIKRSSACDIQISGLSAKEWTGQGLCALHQDTLGTLPCYLPGQGQVDPPVGLLLDKRLGFALGPERITNTGFQTLDDWTAVRGASATVSSGAVTVTTANPQDWGSVCTPIATEPGKSYLVKVLMTSGNGQNVQLLVSESAVNHVNITNTGSARNAAGYYSLVFKATKAVHYVWLGASTNTAAVSVSSWAAPSVREISANYAYQATTTSRPTLSARYNLLTNTSFAEAIAGAPGTAPTGWVFGFSTGEISAVTPLGPDFAIQIATSATRLIFTQQLTAAPNVAYSHWIDVLETTGITAINFIALTAPPSGATMAYWFNGELITSSTVISSPGRLEMRMTVGSTGGSYYVRFGVGCSGNTTGVATIARPDVRVTNDGVGLPAYQRVVDANTYDTVGFPLYLRFDGVDDFLQTASIDFSAASSITAFAAVRKLSDATRGIIFELGTQGYGQPGSFNFEQAWFSPNFSASHSGASGSATTTKAGIGAPASAVLSAVFDQSAPAVRLRYQGQDASQNAGVVGGGGYLNAAIYIGRRAGTSSPASMRLYGAAIRTGVLGGMQIAAVEKRLSQRARIY